MNAILVEKLLAAVMLVVWILIMVTLSGVKIKRKGRRPKNSMKENYDDDF